MTEFGNWEPSHVEPHRRVAINVKVCNSAAKQLNLPVMKNKQPTKVSALADTCTQMCVSDWEIGKKMGLKRSEILTPALTISTADNSSLRVNWCKFHDTLC